MTRLQKALEELKCKGYRIKTLKQLGGGINSAVFKAGAQSNIDYALKLYPKPTKNDPRNRCLTELSFLNYLQYCQLKTTPKLEQSNAQDGWALLSWIEGKRPTKLETNDLKNISEFICAINVRSAQSARSELQPASEACKSIADLVECIAQRIKRLKSTIPGSKVEQEAVQWITERIEPCFRSVSQILLDIQPSCSHWKDIGMQKIVSPSDMGIHNTLKNEKGLYFLDFEYAGLDDLSKLAADWILQPEYLFTEEQEEVFSSLLASQMTSTIGDSWRARLDDIKPLIRIKWSLILLNRLQTHSLSKQHLQKSMAYLEKQNKKPGVG